MELLEVYKDICEQKSLIISSCLALKGSYIHPDAIERVLSGNKLSEFTYDQVVSIFIYNSVLDFIDECEKQNYLEMTGSLALALSNYLMRDISIRKSFISDQYTPEDVCSKLDTIFSLREKERNFSFFIKKMYANLVKSSFFNYDNYIFIYFLITFYFYMEKKQVLICTTGSEETQENICDLSTFIFSLEG